MADILQELKRFEEALASYDRALTLRPDYAEAHFNEALCRMLIGDFDRGWEKNEWRWETEQARNEKRNFAQPLWLGSNEIAGKTILLHAEQGFGDTIQFCRYVPLRSAARRARDSRGPKATARADEHLPGAAQVISRGEPLPDFDMHCPLLSLPLAFGTRLETIPRTSALFARLRTGSSEEMERGVWAKTGDRGLALAWSGNPTHKNDHNRSIRSAALYCHCLAERRRICEFAKRCSRRRSRHVAERTQRFTPFRQ